MVASASLYQRYIDSRAFIESLELMSAFCTESLTADFSLEPDPLRTAALVVYTCSRVGDRAPLARMAEIARNCAHERMTEYENFNLTYVLLAAGEVSSASLITLLSQAQTHGFKMATRSASLAFFLRDEELLYSSVRVMQEQLALQSAPEPELLWELEFGEAMYSALKCGKADLVSLCRMASQLSGSSYLPYVSTDFNVLNLSMARGQPAES